MYIAAQGYALPIDSALIDILNKHLQREPSPFNQVLVVRFRDPDYDADSGGYHPVDIALDDQGRIQWITDFAYTHVLGVTELGRELDFDFSRGLFQHWGFCQPLAKGAAVFQLWQANFIHYAQCGVFEVQVQAT